MAMDMGMGLGSQLRDRIVEIFGNAAVFPDQAYETLIQNSATGDISWYVGVFAKGLAYVLVAWALSHWVRGWLRRTFGAKIRNERDDRSGQIGFLWARAALQALSVAVFALTGGVLVFALSSSSKVEMFTQLVLVGGTAIWSLFYYFFLNLLAPDFSSHRRIPLETEAARSLHRSLNIVLGISVSIVAVCMWMEELGLQNDSHLLLLICGTLTITAMLSMLTYRYRDVVSRGLLGRCPDNRNVLLRFFGRKWHIFVILYFAFSFVMTTYRLLLGLPSALGLALKPAIFVFLGIAVYGLTLIVIDRFSGCSREEVDEEDDGEAERPSLKRLAERAAALLVAAGVISAILETWGVNLSSKESVLVAASDVLIVGFLGYLAFEAIKIAVDRKIEEEGGFEAPEPGDEGGGAASASRLATLLPMFRNFLLITVAVIVGMIILSQIGVDIAPLFAGAGVVGLAVGFGAQTLIRDIFSGAFFLIDDAFRKGEYIDLGEIKGTVEKISIRSMQLRHHLGALHTIPFGEIKQLTNYSRDWAMMKLTLRVTYDTDVERVRKLIKKLGQELLEHPEVGEKFLQPLKSQGVYSMEDSAMILRVKFMTKPGEQFVVRKLVYARIRELFKKEGIQFAHREVTVRVAGEGDAPKLSDKEKEAVAGAALPNLEEAAPVPEGR